MKVWMERYGTTAGAISVASALTFVFGWMALDSWLGAFFPERLDPAFRRLAGAVTRTDGADTARGGSASNTAGIIGVAITFVVVVSLIIVIGLMFKQAWAREAAFVVYGLLGLLVLAASLAGLQADPPAPAAWTGIGVGLLNLSIVGLLMTPSTGRLFSGRPLDRTLEGV